NIGANDVANNVGPAVGAKALTMASAIAMAAVFEAAGALIAGGDVVGTVKKGIIDPSLIADVGNFIWLMMSALLAGALWLNIATAVGAPVSTTHSIVGGVLGAGIAAGGFGMANWDTMGKIAASWVISPALGGVIAALFLYFIKRTITYRADKISAAKHIVPILVFVMTWSFSTYLIMKGLKKVVHVEFVSAAVVSLAFASALFFIVKPWVARKADKMTNGKRSVNELFTIPLIFSAALLSFAHGANDVANAVGPLAAINDAVLHGGISSTAGIPIWVMLIGALGIGLGLMLYGPRLIRTVGKEITELDKMRAFSIAMAASITVIVASQMGLPVSSTHIAVGAVFGVGFLREYLKVCYDCLLDEIIDHHRKNGDTTEALDRFIAVFDDASLRQKGEMIKKLKENGFKKAMTKKERKMLKKQHKRELVKRSAFIRIVAAWLITVPASASIAALLYFLIQLV
ncbi:MAG TPA: inorganic phosphate transporter, partial [Gammaproteobacteria bacterium]|nr:inorganic phosphate transporter [Gammaproteobacteria bacterium]